MRHVLVIRLSALGDVALMAPVLKNYSEANPDVRFTVAGPPRLQPLFAMSPNVAYLGLKKKQSFVKIFKALNAVEADTVIDLHKVNRVGFAIALMHLRHLLDPHFRIYALHKGRLSRWLFLHHWRRKPRKPQYVRYDEVFRRAGLMRGEVALCSDADRTPPTPHSPLQTPHSPLPTPHSPLPTKIGLAPFAQHRGKIWPWENVCDLALALADRGHTVLLFGSQEEAGQLETLAARHEHITSVAGRQSFAEELEIIRSLALMVSMDSANMHFASALGVRVVSIWGATHPDFGFFGYGQNRADALCAGLPCQPCSAYGSKPCRLGDYRCLRAVTPERVLQRIDCAIGS